MKTINPKDVVIGQRSRKQIGWLDSLERSIEKHGVLQPIGITAEKVLVFGERRLRACINLGIEEVPCRVIDVNPDDPATYLKMERDENNERRDFTPEEKIAIASAIEAKLAGRVGRPSENEANVSLIKGKSHEIAAASVGMGKDTYRKAKTVFSEADEATKEAVNNGEKSIHKAYVETKKPKHKPELSRTWKFTLDFDSAESLSELADKIIEEVDMVQAIKLAERILKRYGKLEVLK